MVRFHPAHRTQRNRKHREKSEEKVCTCNSKQGSRNSVTRSVLQGQCHEKCVTGTVSQEVCYRDSVTRSVLEISQRPPRKPRGSLIDLTYFKTFFL